MRGPKVLPLAAAGVMCIAALAACGGSSGDSSAADQDIADQSSALDADQCGLGNGTEATGEPITIGSIATMSNGLDFSSAPLAAKAYFDCVNANGGINGRPIEFVLEDDGLDPQKVGALAERFASDESVVAMVGSASFVGCAIVNPIWAEANLYDIAGVGTQRACFYSSNIAPVNAGPRLSAIAATQYLVEDKGLQTFGQLALGIPELGDWAIEGVNEYLATVGGTSVINELAAPPVSDATPFMNLVNSEEPQAFGVWLPAPDATVVLKAAEQQNLGDSVEFTCQTTCYDTTFPSQVGPYWNGKFTANSEFSLLDATTPDNQLWRAVIQKYGTPDQPRDSFSQAGFIGAMIVVDALLALEPDQITRETASEAIVNVKGFTTDMLCKPWYFGESDRHNANNSMRQVAIDESGNWVIVKDCFTVADPALAPIFEAEEAQGLLG